MIRIVFAATLLATACSSPSTTSSDAMFSSCPFSCPELAECSTLEPGPCEARCDCFPDRWRGDAFDDLVVCLDECAAVGDTYASCVVEVSSSQAPFANPQYIANCEAKRSVCSSYPVDACDPVTLRLLSDSAFSDLMACLAEPCGGRAEDCVTEVLGCGRADAYPSL